MSSTADHSDATTRPLPAPDEVQRTLEAVKRVRHGEAALRRTGAVSFGTDPALVAGAFNSAAGELVGYLGGSVERGERRMTEYEIHKLRYLSSG